MKTFAITNEEMEIFIDFLGSRELFIVRAKLIIKLKGIMAKFKISTLNCSLTTHTS
jgi:hypothetical protein